MGRTYLSVKAKLLIVLEAERGPMKSVARRHNMDPSHIRRWSKNMAKLEATVMWNPRAKTLNAGRARSDGDLEEEFAAWILDRRAHELAVSTNQVIAKAVAINPSFRGGNRKAMWKWVYPFLHRHRLSIRRRTRVAQKLSGHLQEVRREFVAAINERFEPGGTLEGTPASLRVNMDETAVFFEMTSDTTNAVNARTV
ncbi:hypothetical protein PR003_g9918 [Phytophthora rubi]|uniref:HTH CENPB-type domain-containing protein n=1 Tax=Phytophthora rubi TaxID=129364 RepID=A0A6A4FF41_9STRA|nr:hypothetical protein PR003_g9918 [Phytophthora rubi]